MAEYRLFDPANPPAWLAPEWWRDTPNCDHLAHPAGVHTARIVQAARLASDVAGVNYLTDIVDIGAGDGAVLAEIKQTQQYVTRIDRYPLPTLTGYEVIRDSVQRASQVRGVDVREANVTKEALSNEDTEFTRHVCKATRGQRLIVATEFFEHLAGPHAMLRWLSERAEWIIASSPWGETPDKHEYNHAWAWDIDGYVDLFENNGWLVDEVQQVEWSQIIVACRSGDAR